MTQTQNPVPDNVNNNNPPSQQKKGWWTKSKIIIAVIIFIAIGSFSKFLSKNIAEVQELNKITVMNIEQIAQLKATTNEPTGDYFIGTSEEQIKIVESFISDSSKIDPTYLYIGANTAYKIGKYKEAFALYFQAQIRKNFDYKRFNLGQANGNNIQTYWGFLNQTIGANINTKMIERSEDYIASIELLKNWEVVPADDALYVTELSTPVLAKDKYQETAKTIKDNALNYFDKIAKLLSNPKDLAMLKYIQDYNFGKIEKTPENQKQFDEYDKMLDEILK